MPLLDAELLLVFPAQAGVIRRYRGVLSYTVCVPRTGGGDPYKIAQVIHAAECSPHRRG